MIQRTTNIANKQFFCTHCLYDIAPLRAAAADTITCPECGRPTDPYSKKALVVKRPRYLRAFASMSAAALLPGVAIGGGLFVLFPVYVLVIPAIVPPSLLTERILIRTPGQSRRRMLAVVVTGWVLGVLAGIAVWLLIP